MAPRVKAHLSVLLAMVALAKAAGYFLQRYSLDVSNSGYVEGAGYTDVHARLPAMEVLFFISLASAAILLYNIRRQGWGLPIVAIGLWAFVALVIGVIYPAVVQWLHVGPAQSTLERPYITRNINGHPCRLRPRHSEGDQVLRQYKADGVASCCQHHIAREHSGSGTLQVASPPPRSIKRRI